MTDEKKRIPPQAPNRGPRPRIPVSRAPRVPVETRARPQAATTPRAPGFSILRKTRLELEARFGAPVSVEDRTLVFVDGVEPLRAMRLHVFLSEEGTVRFARIELPVPERMRSERIWACASRYNGGHIAGGELLPHTLAGGLRAWHFAGNYWVFPQKDEAGFIFGIKIWQEPV